MNPESKFPAGCLTMCKHYMYSAFHEQLEQHNLIPLLSLSEDYGLIKL